MSGSSIKFLKLLEILSITGRDGFTPSEIVTLSDLPSSSVYRMLSDLESAGYVYRSSDKRIRPNFSFQRRVSFGTIAPVELSSASQWVSNKLKTASEVILLRDQNLVWHLSQQHPDQAIRLRAHAGFVRASYELDSIARLALSSIAIDDMERSWDTAGFFDVGVAGGKVAWSEARRQIQSVDRNEMQFDLLGNSKGVRRFCISIHNEADGFVGLLTAAEAAVPMRDEQSHVAHIRDVLVEARTWLMSPPEARNQEKLKIAAAG